MTDPYNKILEIIIVLREVRDRFQTYSAKDINALIASKLKAVKKEPIALEHLYMLEKMITDLRESLIRAKDEYTAYTNEINRIVE
jgi:hypothetical protein